MSIRSRLSSLKLPMSTRNSKEKDLHEDVSSDEENEGKVDMDGGRYFHKELQRAVSFICYEALVESGMPKATADQHRRCEELYYGIEGNKDSCGFLQQFIDTSGMFSPLFDEETVQNEGEVIFIKPMFHCQGDLVRVVLDDTTDNAINYKMMSQTYLNKPNTMKGDGIHRLGKICVENGRKALALVCKHPIYKEFTLPSGHTYEDYLVWIRVEMCKLEHKKAKERGERAREVN